MKRPSYLIIPALVSAIVLSVAQGCVPTPEAKLFMYPGDKGAEGYTRKGDQGVFENKSIRLAIRRIGDADEEGISQEVIAHLLKKDYLIFRVEMENRSDKYRVIYNPSFTVFTDDAMDYATPMDYTDLYDIAENAGEKTGKDEEKKPISMKGLKGLFYDLSTTIPPGGRTSKLLIFKPASKDCRNAALTLTELYVGTETIKVIFPFVFKPKEG